MIATVLIFRSLFRTTGAYIRYYFLKLIGKPKPLEYLEGDSDDGANNFSHGCLNILVGFPVIALIIIGIAYICFIYFD